MNQIEENVVNSFRLAKNDIIKLQTEMIEMKSFQERLIEKISRLENLNVKLVDKINTLQNHTHAPKIISKNAKKIYLASKDGKKFHITHCPFALNIKPKKLLKYKSKTTALNEGYKPCSCI